MSRTTRRRAVRAVAPVAGLLAAGLLVWQGSYAAFSSQHLQHRRRLEHRGRWHSRTTVAPGPTPAPPPRCSPAPCTVSRRTNIKIGATGVKCITVQSTGTLAGTLKLYRRRHHRHQQRRDRAADLASRSTADRRCRGDERGRRTAPASRPTGTTPIANGVGAVRDAVDLRRRAGAWPLARAPSASPTASRGPSATTNSTAGDNALQNSTAQSRPQLGDPVAALGH